MDGVPLTLTAAASRLGVSYGTAYRWMREGKLPVLRLPGGIIRVKESGIRQLLEKESAPA